MSAHCTVQVLILTRCVFSVDISHATQLDQVVHHRKHDYRTILELRGLVCAGGPRVGSERSTPLALAGTGRCTAASSPPPVLEADASRYRCPLTRTARYIPSILLVPLTSSSGLPDIIAELRADSSSASCRRSLSTYPSIPSIPRSLSLLCSRWSSCSRSYSDIA